MKNCDNSKCRNCGGRSSSWLLRAGFILMVWSSFFRPCQTWGVLLKEDGYHVFPGENIQDALRLAARNRTNKIIKVHAGEYRPDSKRQALIWFNKAHDGIRIEAVGKVTLSAANPGITTPDTPGFPAVVNHVVYFGDGVSSNTVFKGFRLTGANNFVTERLTKQIEPDKTIPKNLFFFTDGGAVKVFGRSYPRLIDLEVVENYASPCGAGISVQHQGFNEHSVLIENCVFLRNRAQVTGSAIDLLAGSSARIINCLFVGNVSNTGVDSVAQRSGEPPFTNSGVLTIFHDSRAWVQNCTFTGNRNAIDDMGKGNAFIDSIFHENILQGGLVKAGRYELDLAQEAKVQGCFITGRILDRANSISPKENVLGAPPPEFDQDYVPQAVQYGRAGYRPQKSHAKTN